MKLITIDDWLGPYANHPGARATVILANGAEIVRRANALLIRVDDDVDLRTNPTTSSMISGSGNGGFRPTDSAVGAVHSQHKNGNAIDIYDPTRCLAYWAVANLDVMESLGLWFEDPRWTGNEEHGWLHVQSVPPGSGKRYFIPSADAALDPDFFERAQQHYANVEVPHVA